MGKSFPLREGARGWQEPLPPPSDHHAPWSAPRAHSVEPLLVAVPSGHAPAISAGQFTPESPADAPESAYRTGKNRYPVAMHITFTIAALGAGGAERVLSLLTSAWATDHRITIISFDAEHDPIFHRFDPRLEIIRLGIPNHKSGFIKSSIITIRRIALLRRTLRMLDPDITISFLTKINVLSLLACLATPRRIIISERNNPRMQESNFIWHSLLSRLQWRASEIVMQTRASLICLHGRARERAHVISNPIEPLHPRPPRSGAPVLAAVGRLAFQKGFDLLIEAFAKVAPSHPDWILRIWGEGELRPALERQIADLGLEDRIHLPGTSRDPKEWVDDADAFVFSSRFEGFGNALAEAAASGLAVISFDCAFGPSDIIDHERTGLLVPTGDVEALSAALDRVLSDERLRARLGEAAREDMSRFAPSAIVAQWDALLARVPVSPAISDPPFRDDVAANTEEVLRTPSGGIAGQSATTICRALSRQTPAANFASRPPTRE